MINNHFSTVFGAPVVLAVLAVLAAPAKAAEQTAVVSHGVAPTGEREYGADVMQLLYVANRYERKPDLQRWLDGGLVLVCDRYMASSVAYGEAFGLDAEWLETIQTYLPSPALTILLDIAPETAAKRKSADRDRYERDLALLARVRESYMRQAMANGWLVVDGERAKETIAGDVYAAAQELLP